MRVITQKEIIDMAKLIVNDAASDTVNEVAGILNKTLKKMMLVVEDIKKKK